MSDGRPARILARAVVVDLDDTLFDHRESARRGLARLIHELGGTATAEIIDTAEMTAERLMGRRRAGEIGRADYRRLRIRHLLADIDQRLEAGRLEDEQCDLLYERFLEVYEEEWVGFADAVPVLRGLHDRRIPVAVLTNGPEERQQRKARVLDLEPWALGVWTSERLAAKKPEASTYLTVCGALGIEPGAVLHIGDNVEHDLHGARAAGLQALHLDRGQAFAESSQRITTLDAVLGML
ncbi:HAD family hydrolase [Brachybacterium alimentarium]|uniref:HAD family hydrolase n=1 Tax=Brachybacterium alimentarium TaxID=47845 RepID=UPI003F8FAE43